MTAGELAASVEEVMEALANFDAERLEAIEARIRTVTAAQLERSRAELPALLRQHARLAERLRSTEANLRVLASVLNLEERSLWER